MANEITWDSVTGLTFNVYRFKTDDNVLLANPATNEVWGTGGRTAADYAIAMSESGASGHYSVDFNAGGAIAAGVYRFVIALQSGVNPANADVKVAKGEIDWDGTAEITLSTVDTVVDTIAGDVVNIDGIVPAAAGDAMTLVADQAVNVTKIAGAVVATGTAQIGVNVVSENNIDFGAAKKTSLNAATPDLTAITSDKDSYKATGFATPTNVTDAHTITDGKIDNVQSDVTLIKAETDLFDGMIDEDLGGNQFTIAALVNAPTAEMDADELHIALDSYSNKADYKATGFNTVVPDAAGTAATLHGTTNGLINGLNDITVADILAGVVEGTITLVQVQRLIMSVLAGLASGGDTTSIKFRDLADTKNRISETVDANGNRTSVTLDLT